MANKIGQYKGLNLGKKEVTPVTGEEVEAELNRMVKETSSYKIKEGKAESGDTVNIDFEGFCDGVAFDGGKGEKYDLALGSGTFIPGFEDQLIGHEKGEDVDVNVTFPENYQAENLKGKAAVFKCKINEVKQKVSAELNDEFAAQYGMPSVQAMREELAHRMNIQKQDQVINEYLSNAFNTIIASSEVEVSEETRTAKEKEMLDYYDRAMAQYGSNLDSFLKMQGVTLDQFKEQIAPQVMNSAKMDVIADYIAETEGLRATDDQIDEEINLYRQNYKNDMTDEQAVKFRQEQGEVLRGEITRQHVSKFIFDNNN